jgi:hypothetical protein
MSEVKRWKLKGFLPGVEGECKAVFQPFVVLADDFDRVTSERDALQLRLNVADQRNDELTQRQGEPVAYAAFADNGNIRCWSSNCEAVGLKVLAEGGSEIVPLYRNPAEQPAMVAVVTPGETGATITKQ